MNTKLIGEFKLLTVEEFFKMVKDNEFNECMESLEEHAMYETTHLNIEEIDNLMYRLEQEKIFTMYNDLGYIELI